MIRKIQEKIAEIKRRMSPRFGLVGLRLLAARFFGAATVFLG
jgi:hypothetical protein